MGKMYQLKFVLSAICIFISLQSPCDSHKKAIITGSCYKEKKAFPGKTWEERSPRSQGVDPEMLDSALQWFNSNSGGCGSDEMVIIRNGFIIWKGPDEDTMHAVFSCTKVFTSTVMGLLATEGKLRVTDLVQKHYPKIIEGNDGQDAYKSLRLMDLATIF